MQYLVRLSSHIGKLLTTDFEMNTSVSSSAVTGEEVYERFLRRNETDMRL